MLIGSYDGFEVHLPTSGGKAGKGLQRTSTLQVRRNNRILKQFRFDVGDPESRRKAAQKARDYIKNANVAL